MLPISDKVSKHMSAEQYTRLMKMIFNNNYRRLHGKPARRWRHAMRENWKMIKHNNYYKY